MPAHAEAKASIGPLPLPASLLHLRARDIGGWGATVMVVMMTAAALSLAVRGNWAAWGAGQALLALAFLQWFVLLHETGHNTLFRTRVANLLIGHVASVFSLVPFFAWRRIHARHHKYTGWQDLDATTALLLPRQIALWEQGAINFAWASYLPLFSIIYRIQNFWNFFRVRKYLTRPGDRRALAINIVGMLVTYALLVGAVGVIQILTIVGPALLLSLAVQDIILLSQHTHMPTNLSGGAKVRCFQPIEQERFTRSLRVPDWLSRLILGFDRHELHHMYVHVPGYDLHRIDYRPRNEVDWLTWLRGAKRLGGTVFLFGDRDQTGFRL